MAQEDYDAATEVVVREVRGSRVFTVGGADAGTLEEAVEVSAFVDATLHYVEEVRGWTPDAFEDGETVGVYGIYDDLPEDSDAETASRDYSEVRVEEVEA